MIEISNSIIGNLKMKTIDFEALLPQQVLFSIKDAHNLGIIKSDMMKKLILNRQISVVKIGSKNFIARDTLIAYLTAHTIPANS